MSKKVVTILIIIGAGIALYYWLGLTAVIIFFVAVFLVTAERTKPKEEFVILQFKIRDILKHPDGSGVAIS